MRPPNRFLCAHLPADASGHARRDLRNACAGASLRSAGEQLGFSVDGGHTYAGAHLTAAAHTFFLGDLNYRAVPVNLGHARDTTLKAVGAARRARTPGAWAAAVADDELNREKRRGNVFAGFEEPPPKSIVGATTAGAAAARRATAAGAGRATNASHVVAKSTRATE